MVSSKLKLQLVQRNKLWLILGVIALAGVCLYASVKLVRRYQATLPRSDADHYLQVGNLKRAYDLHVPASYTGKTPVPLLIALHGVGSHGKGIEVQTGFSKLADQEGFIVVYPDAIEQHWNARRGGKPDTTNDVGFISALVDDLQKRYAIDKNRVYAAGFSNGGTFAHRLGCELSGKIRAIASVAATIPEFLTSSCKPSQPVSVVMIHGTQDEAFPYAEAKRAVLSVPDTLKHWGSRNQCSKPAETPLADVSGVNVSTFKQCSNQAAVTLYTVAGGGHAWSEIHPDVATAASSKFSPSEIIWKFFEATK